MDNMKNLTDEYASELNTLFIDYGEGECQYFDIIKSIFKESQIKHNIYTLASVNYDNIDIVFIRISNSNINFEKLKFFIQSFRRSTDNELLSIYLIKDNVTNIDIIKSIDSCYCLDGMIPVPFDLDNFYRFMYRVLKRITDSKDLYYYLNSLEDNVSNIEQNSNKDTPIETVQETKQDNSSHSIDKSRLADIRFTQDDKMSAYEFVSSLDNTIVDKTETFLVRIDDLSMNLFDFEESDDIQSLDIYIQKIREIIYEAYEIIDSLAIFDIIARTFLNLYDFLGTLDLENFNDKDKKDMFYQMMLAISNDLEKWINDLFILTVADDIHYFDASFASNLIEIENIFVTNANNDDGDLEFF